MGTRGCPPAPAPRWPIDAGISRRTLLALGTGALLLPTARAARNHTLLLAAWQDRDDQHIGLLAMGQTTWSVQQSLKVPTRAHGLCCEADGHVLGVARRPGDWLLRWHPVSGRTQWHWIEGDRRFNGHVITSRNAQTLWTTETDLDNAQGLLGVRDVRTLEKTDEWPTRGMDPHQLLALPQAVGNFPSGTLIVANGGIPTLPETGRSKRELGRMDSSLVALHPATGALLGQWRLTDPFLSIRHLAFDADSGTLGIALQAEHPDEAKRAVAPVLAVWDGRTLKAATDQPTLAGYGGDICAWPGGGFGVSCPRADRLALFGPDALWQGQMPHPGAYALSSDGRQWWLASSKGAMGWLHGWAEGPDGIGTTGYPPVALRSLLIDNHCVVAATG